MSEPGRYAARMLVDRVRLLIESLAPQEWQQPSGCLGWRVQDVIAHLGAGAHQTVEPPSGDESVQIAGTAEQQMEAMVVGRRTWTSAAVKQEYLDYADRSLDSMSRFQIEPVASTMVPILDLGTYPLHILPDIIAFDHYCHLYVDVLAPFGPIDRIRPPVEDDILRPAIGWMLLGLPQTQGRDLHVLRRPLALELTGPGGGRWVLVPVAADDRIQVHESEERCPATVRSSAEDFVRWATGRARWRELAQLSGDGSAAEPFLDRINII